MRNIKECMNMCFPSKFNVIMKLFFFWSTLQVLSLTDGYTFSCPVQSHWRLRSTSLCGKFENYTCLLDVLTNRYRENCKGPKIVGHGYKYVFKPNFDRLGCIFERYQPYIFYTTGYSNCLLLKSKCSDEGQIVITNGSRTKNRACQCDKDRGYIFVSHPKLGCDCIPSEEDCSCYGRLYGTNYSSIHKASSTYKLCNSDAGNMFSSSANIKMSGDNAVARNRRYDYYRYNIVNKCGQSFHTKAAVLVSGALVLLLICCFPFSVCVNKYIINHFKHRINRQTIQEAIKTREETRRYVRIHVVGKQKVGKTCLVRRLLGKEIYDVESTKVLDINVKKCQIRMKDKKWIVGEVDKERAAILKRLRQAVSGNKEETFEKKDPIKHNVHPLGTKVEAFPIASDENSGERILNIDEPYNISGEEQNIEQSAQAINKSTEQNLKNCEQIGQMTKTSETMEDTEKNDVFLSGEIEKFFSQIKIKQNKTTSKGLVECGLWDFAGQKDYYVTHQAFLTLNSIYILVVSLKEDMNDWTDTKKKKETQLASFGEYIEFWFDSIHSLCEVEEDNPPRTAVLNPPIIIVCTHADKRGSEFDTRKQEYEKQFTQILGQQQKINHMRGGICFVSNNSNKYLKEDMTNLRNKIADIADEMEYFLEKLPTNWIEFEVVMSVLRDSGEKILPWKIIQKLAHHNSIKDEKQLIKFLTYQHTIGNIVFFKDLKDYIILEPLWLVKCFRCFLCYEDFQNKNKTVAQTLFTDLKKTGELTETMIDALIQNEPALKFKEHKGHILKVMEKFDIIVKPCFLYSNDDECRISNPYYIPCVITESIPMEKICNDFAGTTQEFSYSPWMIFEFDYFPLACFNYILLNYIQKYTLCVDNFKSKALYAGKAVFWLNKNKKVKLIICSSKNAIAVQLWKWENVTAATYGEILNELRLLIYAFKTKSSRNVIYKIKAKCSDGDYFVPTGRISKTEAPETNNSTYLCDQHNSRHPFQDIQTTWFEHISDDESETEQVSKLIRHEKPTVSVDSNEIFVPQHQPTRLEFYLKSKYPVEKILRKEGDSTELIMSSGSEGSLIYTFDKPLEDDTGTYTCIVSNYLGEDKSEIKLVVCAPCAHRFAQVVLDKFEVKVARQKSKEFIEEELRMVVVGKTGAGKSATCNMIVGKDMFKSGISMAGGTTETQHQRVDVYGQKLLLIDTPGIFDSNSADDEIEREIKKCIGIGAPGLHAILFVMRLDRFTKEDKNTIDTFLRYFGKSEMEEHVIIVFTRGDELGNIDLEDFLSKAPQELQVFMDRCDKRRVVFNNKLPMEQRFSQVHGLISLIGKFRLEKGMEYYTDDLFKVAEKHMQMKEDEIRNKLKDDMEKLVKKNEEMIEMEFADREASLENLKTDKEKIEGNRKGLQEFECKQLEELTKLTKIENMCDETIRNVRQQARKNIISRRRRSSDN